MAKYIVQHRRGTAKQWAESSTLIPEEGELVIEIDEEKSLHKLKIGDGVHSYSELAYLQAGDEVVTQLLSKALPRVVTVTLDAKQWSKVTNEASQFLGYYAQTVSIDGLTNCSRLDLQPSAEMLVEFQNLNLTFVTENKCGIVTVYSVGDKPLESYTMQATIVETDVQIADEKITGIPVGASRAEGAVSVRTFGAVGDGEADDTAAIQAALDQGGVIFFPSGRYKVTSQLNALKPCKIIMQGFYPSSWDGGDYPTATYDTEYGARIETSASGIGLLIGDCVSVDGLAIRAMEGFKGVILKYDGSQGIRTYPSQVRLEHIRVDRQNANGDVVESFFDFNPYRAFGVIVDDVVLGSNHLAQFCEYGFRCSLTQWASSIRISNIIVDTFSHYPFYINTNGFLASNWTIHNLAIQCYGSESSWVEGLIENHITGAYFKGLGQTFITGCKMWDIDESYFTDGVVKYETIDPNPKITAIGNDDYFNALDTEGNRLNIQALESKVEANPSTGGNTIVLSDGTHTHNINLPAVSLTDEQVGNAVGEWMVDNAAPTEQVGKNKLNPAEAEDGSLSSNENSLGEENFGDTDYFWRTGYIEAKKGDTVRFYLQNPSNPSVGYLRGMYSLFEYDENQNCIGYYRLDASSHTIVEENTKYFRVVIAKTGNYGIPRDSANICMITINDSDTAWKDYAIELVGGIGSYLVLSSPNGTRYTLSVSDDGVLSATPV